MGVFSERDLARRDQAERGRGERSRRYKHGERGDGEIVAEYEYRDADGNPHLLVRRVRVAGVDRDQFPQFHWHDGEWVRGKPKGEAIPYRLTELVAAPPSVLVFITEGEKDADAIAELGAVATTAPEGAGKWRPEMNTWFEGRQRICILPDNDEPGRAHGEKVARNLCGAVADVRVLDLPGLPEGGDVSDWIEAGGDLRQLIELYEAAPAYEGSLLKRMNARHCVVSVQGKARVLSLDRDSEGDRSALTFQTFGDFQALHDHRRLQGRGKSTGQGSWWLRQEGRRQYDGLVFRPGEPPEIGGRLNLWQGWGVEPKSGSWELLRRHVEQVLASGNEDHAKYILNWVAWTFQNPAEPAEVALVLRGGKGTGKGVFGRAVKQAFGQHGLQISSAIHLAGRFNAHLLDCALLFADEAFWPGDKAAEGTLKRLITEPTLLAEKKGIDAFEVPNRLHVIMAANDSWVVPASVDERRFAVFDVSDDRKQAGSYFEPLYAEIVAGGVAAMMYDLLKRDLGRWHPRQEIPRTEALHEQITRSLPPEDQWWLDLLGAGELPGALPEAPNIAPMEELLQHAKGTVPGLRFTNAHQLAKTLKKRGCDREVEHRVNGKRAWRFPPLAEARAAWERELPTVWDDPTSVEWDKATDEDRAM